MVITQSVTISPDTFRIDSDQYLKSGVINIEGNNIVVDFQGAVLQGSNDKEFPNEFYGIGVFVKGENIEIRNLNVHRFKIGLQAKEVKNLKIADCNFSYNFRSNLESPPNDWTSDGLMNNNVAGIDLHNCQNFEIKNNVITQIQNGIALSFCKNGLIYNNTITHLSNHAITLFSAFDNRIMHNYLDWNIRDYPTEIRNGGSINTSMRSKNNIVAYNSMTHNGRNTFGSTELFGNNFFPFSQDSIFQNKIIKSIPPLPDGQKVEAKKYQGEKYILLNEWGPYNFEYPAIWLREINEDKYTFAIFGPEGNWKIIGGSGFSQTSLQRGSTPATIVATKAKNSTEPLSLELEFIGVEFTDQFGNKNSRGKSFKFSF